MVENQVREEKVLVIDVKPTRWLAVALVGALAMASLLTYLALTGEKALAVGETAPQAQSAGMRKFYLGGGGLGDAASTSCAAGYHMASLWEIANPSNLKYNTTLGVTQSDSGQGPQTVEKGWVRTGYIANGSTTVGRANCLAWTSGSIVHNGTVAQLPDAWTSGAQDIGVWQLSVVNCHDGALAWCIED
jgi:hypothetical protein